MVRSASPGVDPQQQLGQTSEYCAGPCCPPSIDELLTESESCVEQLECSCDSLLQLLLAREGGEGVQHDPGLVHDIEHCPEQETGLVQVQHDVVTRSQTNLGMMDTIL